MKRYIIWSLLGLVVIAGVVAIAQSNFGGRHAWWMGHGPGGHGLAHIAHQLELNETQRAQIKNLWEADRPRVLSLIRQVADKHKEMSLATARGGFDEARVQVIADQQAQVIAQLLVEKERLESKVYNTVLTPEQRIKADEIQTRMGNRIESLLDRLETGGADHHHP